MVKGMSFCMKLLCFLDQCPNRQRIQSWSRKEVLKQHAIKLFHPLIEGEHAITQKSSRECHAQGSVKRVDMVYLPVGKDQCVVNGRQFLRTDFWDITHMENST